MQTVYEWFTYVIDVGFIDPFDATGNISVGRVLPTLCCTLVVCVAIASLFKFLLTLVR